MGFTADERKFDIIHAQGFLEGRQVSHIEASNKLLNFEQTMEKVKEAHENNMKELQVLTHDLTMMENNTRRLLKSTETIRNWQGKITDRQEVLITQIVRMYLEKSNQNINIYELSRKLHKIEPLPNVIDRGVEWDGVLFDTTENILYLIEAKTSVQQSDITNMASRIKRTLEFINLCGNNVIQERAKQIKDKSKSYQYIFMCNGWRDFIDATRVYGVVGGIGFTQEILKVADSEGLLCMIPSDGIYEIKPPVSGMTNHNLNSKSSDNVSVATQLVKDKITEKELCENMEKLNDYYGN